MPLDGADDDVDADVAADAEDGWKIEDGFGPSLDYGYDDVDADSDSDADADTEDDHAAENNDDADDADAEDSWKIEDGFGPSLDYGRPRRLRAPLQPQSDGSINV